MELVVRIYGIILFSCLVSSPTKVFSKPIEFDDGVHQFINNYCIRCHGIDEEKGDRTFHELSYRENEKRLINLENPDKVNLLQDILDQLNLGEMPPRKKNVDHPSESEIQKVTHGVTVFSAVQSSKYRLFGPPVFFHFEKGTA